MATTSPTHILIDLKTATDQLLRLREQLNEHNGTMHSKGILQGLIEAYTAILMQPKVCIPIKTFL